MQLHIVGVATSLASLTKVQASVAIIGALTDMTRHLRKSIHCSLDDSNLGNEMIQYNQKFQAAVNNCLVELSYKVTLACTFMSVYPCRLVCTDLYKVICILF